MFTFNHERTRLEIEDNSQDPQEQILKLKDNNLDDLVNEFIKKRTTKTLANDQLLKALFMVTKGNIGTKEKLIEQILQDLGQVEEDE
jgi:TRAP-type mannitol/chloroaromatic compound transport system permease large subunit